MRRAALALLVATLCLPGLRAAAQEDDFVETAPPKIPIPMGDEAAETETPDPAPPENADPFIADIGRYWDQDEAAGQFAGESGEETRDDSRSKLLLRGLMALCGTLALILLVYTAIKRWGRKTPLLAGQSLGNVMGRLSLTPHASLHFVRTHDEVLIVGVTQQAVSLLRSYDAADFAAQGEYKPEHAARDSVGENDSSSDFLAQLKEAQGSMGMAKGVDEELDLLKGDLQRLKQYFQDSSREK